MMCEFGLCIMPTKEEFRFYAHECLRWADETDNDEHRQGLLDMAQVWLQLAMQGSAIGSEDSHSKRAVSGGRQ